MRIATKDPHNVEKKKNLIKALGKDQTFWVFVERSMLLLREDNFK